MAPMLWRKSLGTDSPRERIKNTKAPNERRKECYLPKYPESTRIDKWVRSYQRAVGCRLGCSQCPLVSETEGILPSVSSFCLSGAAIVLAPSTVYFQLAFNLNQKGGKPQCKRTRNRPVARLHSDVRATEAESRSNGANTEVSTRTAPTCSPRSSRLRYSIGGWA